jgi:hypothetical protein
MPSITSLPGLYHDTLLVIALLNDRPDSIRTMICKVLKQFGIFLSATGTKGAISTLCVHSFDKAFSLHPPIHLPGIIFRREKVRGTPNVDEGEKAVAQETNNNEDKSFMAVSAQSRQVVNTQRGV